jgi:hypothetical protein
MDYQTFENLINNLFLFFQRKQPDEKLVKLWFSKTNSVPTEAGKWICSWICKEYETIPWNLPKVFLRGWHLYKRENPMRMTKQYERTNCPDCSGEGILWFRRFDCESSKTYEYACRCGSCENYRRHVGALALPARYTLDDLQNMNVEINGGDGDD